MAFVGAGGEREATYGAWKRKISSSDAMLIGNVLPRLSIFTRRRSDTKTIEGFWLKWNQPSTLLLCQRRTIITTMRRWLRFASASISNARSHLPIRFGKPANLPKRPARLTSQRKIGNQAKADKDTRIVQEFVIGNAVGSIREVHVWTDRPSCRLHGEYWSRSVPRPSDTPAVPNTITWDLWIGPAPTRSYQPSYATFNWRG